MGFSIAVRMNERVSGMNGINGDDDEGGCRYTTEWAVTPQARRTGTDRVAQLVMRLTLILSNIKY